MLTPTTLRLPLDIIFSILMRLPIKCLMKLKCVSPQWYKLLSDPCFANMHLTHGTKEPTNLLVQLRTPFLEYSTAWYSLANEEEEGGHFKVSDPAVGNISSPMIVSASCNGLLCLAKFELKEPIFLCNPLTREHITLPKSSISLPLTRRLVGLGFDTKTKEYKVVDIFQWEVPNCDNFVANVCTLGTKSWRRIKSVPYPPQGRSVYANGALHWTSVSDLIVSFDIGDEEFRVTPYPPFESKGTFGELDLLELNGQLAVAGFSTDFDIEVWILKDNIEMIWVKELVIPGTSFPDRAKTPPGVFRKLKIVGIWGQREILISQTYSSGELVSYELDSGRVRDIEIRGLNPARATEIFTYFGSLVSLKAYHSSD